MRISRKNLQKIIAEEKQKLLKEQSFRHPKTGENLFLSLNQIVDMLLDQGMDTIELANELRGIADDVESSGPMMYSEGLNEGSMKRLFGMIENAVYNALEVMPGAPQRVLTKAVMDELALMKSREAALVDERMIADVINIMLDDDLLTGYNFGGDKKLYIVEQ